MDILGLRVKRERVGHLDMVVGPRGHPALEVSQAWKDRKVILVFKENLVLQVAMLKGNQESEVLQVSLVQKEIRVMKENPSEVNLEETD